MARKNPKVSPVSSTSSPTPVPAPTPAAQVSPSTSSAGIGYGTGHSSGHSTGQPTLPLKLPNISSLSVSVLTVVVLLLIMVYSVITIKPQFDNPQLTFSEAPLEKNSAFQLHTGEKYTYLYSVNGTSANLTYSVFGGSRCTAIVLAENPETSVCVDKEGLDSKGLNSTLSDPKFIFFKPWMLALRSGWTWNATMAISVAGEPQPFATVDYSVIRTELYRGREAFVVREHTGNDYVQYDWVDAEKRILLRAQGEGYEIALVDGLQLN